MVENWRYKSLGLLLYCFVAVSAVRVQQAAKVVRGKEKLLQFETFQKYVSRVNSSDENLILCSAKNGTEKNNQQSIDEVIKERGKVA
jgi:hypothetical protein